MLFTTFALAEGKVSIKWTHNTESDLAGYKVYFGNATRVYQTTIDVGNNPTIEVIDLVEGDTYYFAATAYDTSGNESDYSTELVYTVPKIAPNAPQGFSFTITIEVKVNQIN